MHVDHEVARTIFLDELDALLQVCEGLDDVDLVAASRCRGWTVGDVLVHVHLGLQDMLLGLVSPTESPADTDAASYWRHQIPTNDPEADAFAGMRFVRLLGAAYRKPSGIVGHMRPTASGVMTVVRGLPSGSLHFQGHVLTTGDFLATWAVELVVHHLDLGRELHVGAPTTPAMSLTVATVEGLLGGPLPTEWSQELRILAGTGRVQLNDDQAHAAGSAAKLLPVLG
jgi:uncharacterized protein (TIGR03083 family)